MKARPRSPRSNGPDGRWDISVHFAEAPDQASIRELVSLAAGDDIAQHITFDTVEAKDWVAASLEDLVPVPAGRFIVHGRHDRARVPLQQARHRDRGGAGVRHRASRHHARLPVAAGRGAAFAHNRGACSISEPAPACSPSPRRRRCGGGCWRATSIRSACTLRATTRGSMASAIWWKQSARPDFPRRNSQSARPFDLVLANILANPLRQMATPMAAHLAPSALVILSGLLPHQAQGVIASYRARGLVVAAASQIDGWSSLLMQRAA